MLTDLPIVFQWWGTLFLVGAAAYPLTRRLFGTWFDRGYLFAKAVGLATVTYGVYILGILHMLAFTKLSILISMGAVFVLGLFLTSDKREKEEKKGSRHAMIVLAEEVFFFAALLFWTWVKAHEPSIHNLEKFMDFGFTKSILDSRYFPAPDMWYAGGTINYYYFGHTVMAVLTRLSGIDLTSTFNLMLSTIFALCFTMSFSIGRQLLAGVKGMRDMAKTAGGVLTAFLVTLTGNMQTIYAFTQGYDGDKVKPFWQLLWPIKDVVSRLPDGLNRYWYANATRFIPYTIHEFPSYSFVVSDIHGHVLSIPFVLLAIALLVGLFTTTAWHDIKKQWPLFVFYGFLGSVLLMTNALDGPIYIGLFLAVLVVTNIVRKQLSWEHVATISGVTISVAAISSLPFLLYFKSFVTGVAVNCPPSVLANSKIGPILFEGVEKCQHSPLWMLWLLWGFFVYCGLFLIVPLIKKLRQNKVVEPQTLILGVLFVFSILLIIFPEFFYFKDIYPMHFRSNTMFKLGYQAFIMFSIIAGYTIATKFREKKHMLFFLLLTPQLFLVSIYPIFSVRSYFNSLRTYESVSGIGWIARQYPDDWAGIRWLNDQLSQGKVDRGSVIVEADGDSYTDYDRVSAFTGLSTIIGWPVHEWLWRGSYDVVAPRREEVRRIFESEDINETQQILTKYHVRYIFVGQLEREKFSAMAEWKFTELGKPVFTSGETVIYQLPQ